MSGSIKDRIKQLSEQMELITKDLKLDQDIIRPSAAISDGKKRMSAGFCFDENLVHKIKNAVRLGYIKNIIALEPALWAFINEVEAKNGLISTRPSDKPLTSRWSGSRTKLTPSEILVRSVNRQIKKLKEEFDK